MAYTLTIVVAWTSVCIFLAVLVFPLWLKERSRVFLLVWSLALALKGGALAGFIWLSQDTPNSWLLSSTDILAIAVLAAAEALMAAALVSLYGASRPFRFAAICLAIWAGALATFYAVGFGRAATVSSNSLIVIVIASYVIAVLSASRNRQGVGLRHVISSVYAIQAILAFASVAIYLGTARDTELNSAQFLTLTALAVAIFAAKVLLGVWISIDKFENDLRQLAYNDSLTGILNRRGTLRDIETSLQQSEKERIFAYLTIDIDHFKAINDELGHCCGDHALIHFTRTVGTVLERDDVFGRIGGEEFAVFTCVADPTAAVDIAERIGAQVQSSSFTVRDKTITLTASIGIAVSTVQEANLQTMLNQSDRALYQAKEAGRNRTVLYCPPSAAVTTNAARPAQSA